MYFRIFLIAFSIYFYSLTNAYLSTYEAANHIGRIDEVCGFCVSITYEKDRKGSPTILDFEKKYPEQVFSAIIYDYNLKKFDKPLEEIFLNKPVCVRGEIDAIKGIPFIVVSEPAQIKIMERYKIDSDEIYKWKQTRDYHNMWFKSKDRIKVKILLKALGYEINEKSDLWDIDTHRAVIAFQKQNKLPEDGLVNRKVLIEMEKCINKSKKLDYKQKKYLYYLIQSLLKRKI